MINVEYPNSINGNINKAIFTIDETKTLEFSIVDGLFENEDNSDVEITKKLKILITDTDFGDESMFIETTLDECREIVSVFQKIMRQLK